MSTISNCWLLKKDLGELDLCAVAKMTSVESLRRREVYDECYVVFMTFVIRSHDRLCNYDVLCWALPLLKSRQTLSINILQLSKLFMQTLSNVLYSIPAITANKARDVEVDSIW